MKKSILVLTLALLTIFVSGASVVAEWSAPLGELVVPGDTEEVILVVTQDGVVGDVLCSIPRRIGADNPPLMAPHYYLYPEGEDTAEIRIATPWFISAGTTEGSL